MSSESYKLDALPVEIIRRIASLGACEAALALSEANRTLRTACNDRLVFKAILDNRNGNAGPEWRHRPPLTMDSPVSSWGRYALADSKSAHDHTSTFDPQAFVSWAPQLMAYHHPIINLYNVLTLSDALRSTWKEATGSTQALAFCLALRLMSQEPAGYLELQGPTRVITAPWVETRRDLARYLKQPLNLLDIDSSHISIYNPKMLMWKRIQALMAVGAFSMTLRETIQLGDIRDPSGRSRHIAATAVPTSTDIPFHLMMNVPLPFSPSATMELGSCHLAKMTTVHFLEDGEWAGFYSVSFGQGESIDFDPPMHGIRFVATANSNSSTTLNLQGTGEDGIGPFSLYGSVVPETGHIFLKKLYLRDHTAWDWACLMTPLGIVGSWGRRSHGGWIWLWKVGWTSSH